jgi:phage terminase large subunit-like protein
VTRGSTYDNAANLAAPFLEAIRLKYEGTRLGRQEIGAELLDDNPYALWKRSQIEALRVQKLPDLVRVFVGIDPQGADPNTTSDEESAETGIVVVGVDNQNPPHGYVLEDASVRGTPLEWARAGITAFHKYKADRIVAEVNNGGAMVEFTLRSVDRNISYTAVHASRGKVTRAEPVAALYEQGRMHHLGAFPLLEDQMCEWIPGEKSPDRMDALVWAATQALLGDVSWGTNTNLLEMLANR